MREGEKERRHMVVAGSVLCKLQIIYNIYFIISY